MMIRLLDKSTDFLQPYEFAINHLRNFAIEQLLMAPAQRAVINEK